jgi:hypothetical protein
MTSLWIDPSSVRSGHAILADRNNVVEAGDLPVAGAGPATASPPFLAVGRDAPLPDEYVGEHDADLENLALDLLLDSAEVSTPSTKAIRWLLSNGVAIETITRRWAIGAAHVCFQPTGRYTPVSCGDFAFVFACMTIDGVADLAAWQPSTARLMTRFGFAGLLGQRQAEEARDDITARPVQVWRNPLHWLRAGRGGVVVIDRAKAAHLLGDLNVTPDPTDIIAHGRELKALRVPPPCVLVRTRERGWRYA